MNETQPVQKQDIDRLDAKLSAILDELRRIREAAERPIFVLDSSRVQPEGTP